MCTQKHIRHYFLEGTLPEPGTVCPVLATPFPTDDLYGTADAQAVLGSTTDRELLDAVRKLATTFDPLGISRHLFN
jgi:hypothetical protein